MWISVLVRRTGRRGSPNVACWLSALPTAITTSASRNAFQALAWPLSQNTPTASGWLLGTMPLPSSVVSNGSWKRSISRCTSALGAAADRAEADQRDDLLRPCAKASASTSAICLDARRIGQDRAHASRRSR